MKTNFINLVNRERQKNHNFDKENQNDLAASLQRTIVEMLMANLTEAALQTGINDVALAGGVSANSELRNALIETGRENGWQTFIPPFEFCTDNGAMIAIAGYFDYRVEKAGSFDDSAQARWGM